MLGRHMHIMLQILPIVLCMDVHKIQCLCFVLLPVTLEVMLHTPTSPHNKIKTIFTDQKQYHCQCAYVCLCVCVCDRLCINHPFMAKAKFSVRAKVAQRSGLVDIGFVLQGVAMIHNLPPSGVA